MAFAYASLMILFSGHATAFSFRRNVDFAQCYDQLVQLNNTDFNNNTIYSAWNASHDFVSDPRQLVLTLQGCEAICGDGYNLWPSKDTLDRLLLWVLPAIILLTHFQFPPLSAFNTAAVILHAAGDPLDSLWSMLTRLETQRRLVRAAKGIAFQGSGDYKFIASLWAAYEEIGWQDVSGFFEQSLVSRAGRPPNKKEMYHIMLASHELWSNRQDSLLLTWVAIVTLAYSLMSAVIRTIEQTEQQNTRIYNEIAHSIALVSLLFIFIPLVKISGNISSFASSTVAVHTIEKLNLNLRLEEAEKRSVVNEQQLFPPLILDPDVDWHISNNHEHDEVRRISFGRTNIECWPEMASYFGLNSSWRPCKKIRVRGPGRSAWVLCAYCIIFAVIGSAFPAILLSATNHAGELTMTFGCRALSWAVILSTWLLSLMVDRLLQLMIRKAKALWRYTLLKDTMAASFIVVIVLAEQVGLYNSCWCRSNAVTTYHKAYVNLNPYTNVQWWYARLLWSLIPSLGMLFTGLLTLFIEYYGGFRGPLHRSSEEVHQNLVHLQDLSVELWPLTPRGKVGKAVSGTITEKSALIEEFTT